MQTMTKRYFLPDLCVCLTLTKCTDSLMAMGQQPAVTTQISNEDYGKLFKIIICQNHNSLSNFIDEERKVFMLYLPLIIIFPKVPETCPLQMPGRQAQTWQDEVSC